MSTPDYSRPTTTMAVMGTTNLLERKHLSVGRKRMNQKQVACRGMRLPSNASGGAKTTSRECGCLGIVTVMLLLVVSLSLWA